MTDIKRPMHSDLSWWSRRTGCEKFLLALCILAIASSLSLTILMLKKYSFGTEKSDICQSGSCIISAARIIQNMNKDADPCEDFYEFACGHYSQNIHIPEDKTMMNSFSEIYDKIEENLRVILEEPIKEDEILPFQQAKKLYRMCMNSTEIYKQDFKIFKDILKKMGGWPVLEGSNWDSQNFDWKTTQYNFRKMGFHHTQFISSYVGLDERNTTKRIFTIDQPCGNFAKILKKGFNETIVKAYYDFLVDYSILYGADKVVASRDMMEYLEFRIELAKIIIPSEERRNHTKEYNPMTIRELQVNYPTIPWLSYINTKLEPYVSLTYDDIVIVSLPEYLEKLEKLLATTPKRAIANYLFLSIAEHFAFNDDMEKRRLAFEKVLYGVTSHPPKWKMCVSSGYLDIAESAMYVRRFLTTSSKHLAQEVVADVRAILLENLKKNTWMDHKTKKRAVQKAEEMRTHVGYPEELLDNEEIVRHYEGVVINEESILKTDLALSIWSRNTYLRKYYQPYDKDDWKNNAFPTVVNAFYNAYENSIKLPSGILHRPFFDPERPHYLNYGAIGFIIGHEFIHGFDDQGRQFNKDGNLVDWWEPAANESFHEKVQCIIEQYGNLTHQHVNMSLNGVNTQGENIADIGGIKMAYSAYQRWLQRNEPEMRLPGLNYTPQQMFWIAAANDWCAKVRPEMQKLRILIDVHSPDHYRVIIPLINSGYFARDFNCPLGSPMNPKHKCRLW